MERAPGGVGWRAICIWLLCCVSCGFGDGGDVQLRWSEPLELNRGLPAGIRVFHGSDAAAPLRVWYARIDEPSDRITTRVVVSADEDRRESAASFAARLGARVVVNAGYFRGDREPARHVGLLLINGEIVEPAIDSVIRGDTRYHTTRAALGFSRDGAIDVAWVSSRHGSLYVWKDPPPNAPESPVASLDETGLPLWQVRDAVAAGPSLLSDGRVRITSDEEVFFDTPVDARHPRTAAGYTRSGELVLLVVDGRQPASRGVSLLELADLMRELGCVEALNLDGGGSSTLVVNGELVNRPVGSSEQREVMSALAVFAPAV